MPLNIVILSYYFPPVYQVGVKRAYYFAKFFASHGQNVKVITSIKSNQQARWEVPLQNIEVIKIPQKDQSIFKQKGPKILQKLIRFLNLLFAPIDVDNRLDISEVDVNSLGKVDFIIASLPPWHILELGVKLKKKIPGSKLVADFRDIWMSNDDSLSLKSLTYKREGLLGKLIKNRFNRTQSKWLKKCDGLLSVSEPLLNNLLKQTEKTIKGKVIYNGFDNIVDDGIDYSKESFIISYTGIVRSEQFIELFLEGFELFLDDKDIDRSRVKCYFVGSYHPQKLDLIAPLLNSKHSAQIEVTPFVSKSECEVYQKKSSVLLQLGFEGKRGIVSSKIFEYISMKRPILIASKENEILERLVKETNAGVVANSAELIASKLKTWYNDWTKERLQSSLDHKKAAFYSYNNQVVELERFLDELNSSGK